MTSCSSRHHSVAAGGGTVGVTAVNADGGLRVVYVW